MFRRFKVASFGVLLGAICGCTADIAGTWQVVDVQPKGASFPLNRVTFDLQGKYTSAGLYDAQGRLRDDVQTATGRFERMGDNLRLIPANGTAVSYQMRRRLDGKIEMTLDIPGQNRPLTAVLSPTAD